MSTINQTCNELRALQRQRDETIRGRIRITNALTHNIAVAHGYHTGLESDEREAQMTAAAKLIKEVEEGAEHPLAGFIRDNLHSVAAFDRRQAELEKSMVRLAKQLPVAAWTGEKGQRGFGLLSLAVIVGECGNIGDYRSPACLWKRMGCAPFAKDNSTQMGSTWKSGRNGKLSADDWTAYGYSPRRRSIMYVISESLLKTNDEGPYRARYDEAKAYAAETHPDWTLCTCAGSGKTVKGGKCTGCSGRGTKMLHCHKHAMLLMAKRLLRELWRAWRKQAAAMSVGGDDFVSHGATAAV